MPLAAGKRDKKIRLLRLQQANDHGDIVEEFAEFATAWAFMRALRGDERMNDGGPLAQRDVEFQILLNHTVATLSPADRIACPGPDGIDRVYDIAEVSEIGRDGLSVKGKLRDAVNV